jgi:Asp-tRNA(Asn)/Glu-tRNA(Gln) amidotransferase A subunit family amidase
MRAAGAIPIMRSNMPDMGMLWSTDNALFGATVNPWNPGAYIDDVPDQALAPHQRECIAKVVEALHLR